MPNIETNAVILEDLDMITGANLPWYQLANKNIMISGGGGFLGSYIVKALVVANKIYNLNLRLICIARDDSSVKKRLKAFLEEPEFVLIKHDITQQLPEDFPRADLIIHSASQASPKFYGSDPVGTLKANLIGTMFLVEHAVKCKSEKFLFFSSGEVYGQFDNHDQIISESDYGYLDPMQVRSCYAESKRVGETICSAYAHQFGTHVNVIRPFHTYGPGMALDDGRVFADFVADVVEKRDIVLKSDGLASRPFCYISDATLGFLTVLLKGSKSQSYNVANPDQDVSIKELAKIIAGLFPERSIGVTFDIMPSSNNYLRSPVMRQLPNIEKISRLGWMPVIDISTGFRRTITSYL